MRFVSHFLGLCVGFGLLACSGSEATTVAIVRPQLLQVLPDDFFGTVRCSPDFDAVGAAGSGGSTVATGELVAKSYVATLTDVTPTDDHGGTVDFTLASSPPTPCSQPVTFSYLVTLHQYVARVDAYSENARELTPFASGSPLLLDSSGNRVAPRWSTECSGYPPSPAAGGSGGSAGAPSGGAAGSGGNPGVVVYDTLTQTPHDCGAGLTPIE